MADAKLQPINRRHLEALTGELGIFQHAARSEADPAHGYCVDDVARAIQVDLLHARSLGWPAVLPSIDRGLRYVEDAFDPETARFRNFRDVDGTWAPGPGSNDSVGRAMLALGETIAAAPSPEILERALGLFSRALPMAARMTSPRAQASLVLACGEVAKATGAAHFTTERSTRLATESEALMRRLATTLHATFLWSAGPGWPWLEPALTYENALIPRALIVAGDQLGADVMRRIGLQVLDWLIENQTAPAGHLTPIGNGWWPRNGTRSQYDQQPIEATALLLAAEAGLAATGSEHYRVAMERAYAWFLGQNDRRRKLVDATRGACADGLTPTGVNKNEGAESTLMWLIAAEHIRDLRAAATRAAAEPDRSGDKPAREVSNVRSKTVRSTAPTSRLPASGGSPAASTTAP